MKIKVKKINPSRDWRIIVWSFALVLIVISGFSWRIYLSEKIGGGYFTKSVETTESATREIDIKRLKKAVTISEKRDQAFRELKNNLLRPLDPSN
jgi:hypothetical protein